MLPPSHTCDQLLFKLNRDMACAHSHRSESEKPTFPIGVLGPFSKQAFYVLLFDFLSAKLDFESSNPILTTDLSGRSINSSCFGIDLFIYDEQASQVEARKGAHRPTLPLSHALA